MDTLMNRQQLRNLLVGLGVRSPELAGKAEAWLKPILADSAIYQNLSSKAASALAKYKEKERYFLIVIGILLALALTHRYWKNLEFGTLLLCLFAPAAAGLVWVIQWINRSFEYRGAARERDRFVKQWVERVEADPANVEKLARFDQAIQDLKAMLQEKGVGSTVSQRDQAVDYLLTAGEDAAQVLSRYIRAVETSKLDGTVRYYLLSRAFFYALMYLYNPGGFQAFVWACYARYLENRFSFDPAVIEKIFDEHIPKTRR